MQIRIAPYCRVGARVPSRLLFSWQGSFTRPDISWMHGARKIEHDGSVRLLVGAKVWEFRDSLARDLVRAYLQH